MRRNPLWNLVFIVILIMAFIWTQYYRGRGKRVLLAEYPVTSPAKETIGKVSFFSEDHRDKLIRIQLLAKPREEVYVILYTKEGVGRTAGKLSGTVFIRSLGVGFSLEGLSSVVLKGVKSGLVYGEAAVRSPTKG